ncbi:hypothetical protein [Flavihumibacter sp. UBA7668]|uniref:hypothetical protein n=1 Tax=Flavihumibacter sp. UBA7668 TaxID=1946542 RepID=UPI0025BEF565|nr:hypothetical protein [Flavihumibacter sp. UBA7668]
MKNSTTHTTLRKRRKTARRKSSYFAKSTPSYRDNQNEQMGSYEESKDGYPEKNVTEDSAKSAE